MVSKLRCKTVVYVAFRSQRNISSVLRVRRNPFTPLERPRYWKATPDRSTIHQKL